MGEWIDNLCQVPLPFPSAAVQIDAGPFNLYFLLLAFTTRSNFYLFISYKAKHSGRARSGKGLETKQVEAIAIAIYLACKGCKGLSRPSITIHQSSCVVFAYHLSRQVNKKPSAKHRRIANWLTICTVGTSQCRNNWQLLKVNQEECCTYPFTIDRYLEYLISLLTMWGMLETCTQLLREGSQLLFRPKLITLESLFALLVTLTCCIDMQHQLINPLTMRCLPSPRKQFQLLVLSVISHWRFFACVDSRIVGLALMEIIVGNNGESTRI